MVRDGSAIRYRYDIADQLVAVESAGRRMGLTYDTSGRLTEEYDGDFRHTITYNGLGHPQESVRTRDWAIERLCPMFDGDGALSELRLRTGDDEARQTTVCYRWSTGETIPQILSQAVNTQVPDADDRHPLARELASARFTYGYGRTFATAGHGSVSFARDVYGSAIQTGATRPWVQAAGYDAFGLPTGERHDDEPDRPPLLAARIPRFGYRGELTYGTVLDLRARFYDAAVGRFTSRDPVSVLGQSALANNPYAYVRNDPLNRVDPLGTWSFGSVVAQAIDVIIQALNPVGGPCTGCPNPGNGIQSHPKCFQNTTCLAVRGSISQEALDADSGALRDLATRSPRQIERAGQALAIWTLNLRRRGFWDWFWGRVPVNFHVDWEVGTRGPVVGGFRVDIMTEERYMYEVKRWHGDSTVQEVQDQLDRYRNTLFAAPYLLNAVDFGTDLQNWIDRFDIGSGLWNWLGLSHEWIYVWGLGNKPGHIYVAPEDEVPDCDYQQAALRAPEKEQGTLL